MAKYEIKDGKCIITEQIETIEAYAFENCTELTSIVIPESVTKIERGAFKGCTGLTFVRCNAVKVPTTDIDAFSGSNIANATLKVPEYSVSKYYASKPWKMFGTIIIEYEEVDGIYYDFNYANKQAKVIMNPDGYEGDVTIPEIVKYNEEIYYVTSIGEKAFCRFYFVTSVTIPDSVTEICKSAFAYCMRLKTIELPKKLRKIGPKAFFRCNLFTEVTVPEDVTEIGDEAFAECPELTTIRLPKSLMRIGSKVFSKCNSLTEVTIPEDVTEIGEEAFAECTGLTSISFPKSLIFWGCNVLRGCYSLEELIIPSCRTEIYKEEFKNMKNLKKLVIPQSVKTIKDKAFYDTNRLTSVNLPKQLEIIGDLAFCGSGLTSLTLPGSVTDVGTLAFDSCAIEKLTLNNNAALIAGKFCAGTHLKVDGIGKTIPKSMFSLCYKTETIEFSNDIEIIEKHAFFNCTKLQHISAFPRLKKICTEAFSGCESLTSIEIPNNIKLESNAFQDCSNQMHKWLETQPFYKNLDVNEQKEIKGRSILRKKIYQAYMVITFIMIVCYIEIGLIMLALVVIPIIFQYVQASYNRSDKKDGFLIFFKNVFGKE